MLLLSRMKVCLSLQKFSTHRCGDYVFLKQTVRLVVDVVPIQGEDTLTFISSGGCEAFLNGHFSTELDETMSIPTKSVLAFSLLRHRMNKEPNSFRTSVCLLTRSGPFHVVPLHFHNSQGIILQNDWLAVHISFRMILSHGLSFWRNHGNYAGSPLDVTNIRLFT